MSIVAFIFCRGGSKGLPGKNIRLLGGKPLIAWSIDQARSVKCIDRVIVSTDCEEIAAVARNFGAEVPFIRPTELAQDESSEWLAWRHALSYLYDSLGVFPKTMVSVPATAPLRSSLDIEKCINLYEEGDVDIVITKTTAHRNPYFNMVKVNSDGTIALVNTPDAPIVRRQDAPEVFDMSTVCYVANPEFVMTSNSHFEGRVKAVNIPPERSIDIDTLLDFQFAEYLLNLKMEN
ncbi:acylneuraminate cytidylyltransferase family protein [Amylibacter sp.]|nr:acylneuraminate cytidylyltransferase family protein [Amylibacter sp.]